MTWSNPHLQIRVYFQNENEKKVKKKKLQKKKKRQKKGFFLFAFCLNIFNF